MIEEWDEAPEPGALIYEAMLSAPDVRQALRELPVTELRSLYGWLLRNYQENAVSGMVLGELLVAAAEKILMKDENEGGEA
jgi:hypothetical protein